MPKLYHFKKKLFFNSVSYNLQEAVSPGGVVQMSRETVTVSTGVFEGVRGERRMVRHIDRTQGVVHFTHMEPQELRGREERTTVNLFFESWARKRIPWI